MIGKGHGGEVQMLQGIEIPRESGDGPQAARIQKNKLLFRKVLFLILALGLQTVFETETGHIPNMSASHDLNKSHGAHTFCLKASIGQCQGHGKTLGMVYYRPDRKFPLDQPQDGQGNDDCEKPNTSILAAKGAEQSPEENKTSQERNQCPWRAKIEGRYNGEGTGPCTKKIHGIHAMGLLPGGRQYDAHDPPCEEERQGHDHVGEQQVPPLGNLPDELKGIQPHPLGKTKGQGKGDRRCPCQGYQAEVHPFFYRPHKEEQKGPGRTISQKGHADDHKDNMVPLPNGNHSHQQDFIGQNSGRSGPEKQAVGWAHPVFLGADVLGDWFCHCLPAVRGCAKDPFIAMFL